MIYGTEEGRRTGGVFSSITVKKSGKRPFLNCDGDERNIGLAKQVTAGAMPVHHRNTHWIVTRTPDSPPKNGPPYPQNVRPSIKLFFLARGLRTYCASNIKSHCHDVFFGCSNGGKGREDNVTARYPAA